MKRQNLFSDKWDGENEEAGSRHRIFWRPDDARMGATLYELAPGAPDEPMHMHFGAEEMFFVLSGRPVLRNQQGEEELAPGDFVFCPEGRAGLHTFSNPTEEAATILAISAGSFPDVVAYPEAGYAWVATRDPDLLARGGDPGIIARFEIPVGVDPPPYRPSPGSGTLAHPCTPLLPVARWVSTTVRPGARTRRFPGSLGCRATDRARRRNRRIRWRCDRAGGA